MNISGPCYPILLVPIKTVSIYSYGQRQYTAVVCDAFILDKGKARHICCSTALTDNDNSMHKRYRILVRANNENKQVTHAVCEFLKSNDYCCVTNDYYIKHVKYPEFEENIIELNACGIWEEFSSLEYDIKLKKKSKDMLIQAAKISEKYNLDFENK